MENNIQPGLYQHYKGKNYLVLGVGHHSETLEELVFYTAQYASEEFGENALWVRPIGLFLEKVEIEGVQIPRFKKIASPVVPAHSTNTALLATSEISLQLQKIEERNRRVTNDKAWEGSWTRKLCIMGITYLCALSFMKSIGAEPLFLNACVPVLGYFLSTLTLPPLKTWWVNSNAQKKE